MWDKRILEITILPMHESKKGENFLLYGRHLKMYANYVGISISNSILQFPIQNTVEFMITPYVLLMPHLIIFIGDEMVVMANVFVWKAQLTVALWSSHISRCAPFPCDNNN